MKITIEREVCDRCGEEFKDGHFSRIGFRIGYWLFGSMAVKDVCRDCRDEFDKWWGATKPTRGTER